MIDSSDRDGTSIERFSFRRIISRRKFFLSHFCEFPFFLLRIRITDFSMEMLRVNVFVVFSIYSVNINGHKQTEDFEIYRLILLY